jgi:tetratricopeptide (TPR) repeat protein
MKARWLLCGLLGMVAACPAAQAGLYLSTAPPTWPLTGPPPSNPGRFLQVLGELQSLASTEASVKEMAFPREIQGKVEELERRRRDSSLSVEDSITLGGYYLLQGKHDKAVEVLRPAHEKEPKNFMVLANLANAFRGIGEGTRDSAALNRAIGLQSQVLKNWPSRLAGWTSEELWWHRRAEKYYLQLLELRNRAQLTGKPPTLDNLFPAAPYADPLAKYVVGEIDIKARDRLPPDALPLVEQLLLWMPNDQALLWQFGELLNARGEVKLAWDRFRTGTTAWSGNALFNQHRREFVRLVETDPRFKEQAETTSTLPQDLGGLNKPGPTTEQRWLPDWRQLAVGFGTGLIVGMLLLLQFRQLSRRFSRSQQHPTAT